MGGLSQLGKKTYYKILIVDIVLNSEKLNMSLWRWGTDIPSHHSFNILEIPTNARRQEKDIEGLHIGKENIKFCSQMT